MISILTPTYNRGYTIGRLSDSLNNQTCNNFEWVVVDDGSTDNTSELVRTITNKSKCPVKYFYKNNGGKHTALNSGVSLCAGDWILIVDSDDFITENAVELVINKINGLSEDVVGICFRKSYLDGTVIGKSLIDEVVKMTPAEAGHYYQGDLAYVFKKTAMLAQPFPVFEGERFVPELCIWNKISDLGHVLFYSSISFYRCEYLPDGYSANFKKNLRRNPRGFAYHYLDALNRERNLFYKFKAFVRLMQCYWYSLIK